MEQGASLLDLSSRRDTMKDDALRRKQDRLFPAKVYRVEIILKQLLIYPHISCYLSEKKLNKIFA